MGKPPRYSTKSGRELPHVACEIPGGINRPFSTVFASSIYEKMGLSPNFNVTTGYYRGVSLWQGRRLPSRCSISGAIDAPWLKCSLDRKVSMEREMISCELLEQCLFFSEPTAQMPSTAKALKARYCTGGGHHACARYIISRKLGKEQIPEDLFPNQLDRLLEVLGFL